MLEFIEVKQVSKLVCFDCKQEICTSEDFMPYYRQGGDCEIDGKPAFVKCVACHKKDPALHYQPCEVYSRVVGYIRPVEQWNRGKKAEWKDRVVYKVEDALGKK